MPVRRGYSARVRACRGTTAIAVALAVGCGTPVGVRHLDARAVHRHLTRNVLSADALSTPTQNVLFQRDLMEDLGRDPAAAIRALHAVATSERRRRTDLYALAELSFQHAERGGGRPFHVAAAIYAYAFLAPSDPDYEQVDRLLQRYREQAPDRFEVVFKDPRKAPDLAQKYQLREGQTTLVLTRGTGDAENHTTVSVSGGVTEQDLTNALIKLNAVGEQKVYFTTGHGEWPLEPTAERDPASLSELRKTLLQEGYVPGTLNLADGKEVPKDAALLVVAGAKSKFGKAEAEQLGKYLAQGGRMLYFAEAQAEPGLDALLARYGIQVDPGLMADDVYAIDSPYLVVSHFFGETELARDLKKAQYNLQFPTVRGLTALHEGLAEGTQVAPVLLTSPNGFEVKTPTENPRRQSGDRAGSIPLILQSTRTVGSAEGKRNDEMRIVAFGDSEILVDPNWGDEPNRNMVMNAFAWATNQVQKITIRPPDRDISTIDLDASRLARIRFLATDLVPFGLLGVGLAIWLNRRNK